MAGYLLNQQKSSDGKLILAKNHHQKSKDLFINLADGKWNEILHG
ncbi:hypothetical protein AUTU_29590 [Aureibacter tunicatorum]|nr:hypothetical protein AUTU_29590 [Aureibacter tunicatorum]